MAVVAGDYAALMLIDGRLIDFGVAAALCAGSSVAAGLIAYAETGDAARRWRGDERPVWERPTCRRLPSPTNSARYAEGRAKHEVTHLDSLTGRNRGYAGHARRPRADTMSLRPAWVPVLTGEQRDRVRRGTASPALAPPGIGSGGIGHLMTPAWKYRHERTRRHVGLTAPQSKNSQGRKKPTRPAPRGRRR